MGVESRAPSTLFPYTELRLARDGGKRIVIVIEKGYLVAIDRAIGKTHDLDSSLCLSADLSGFADSPETKHQIIICFLSNLISPSVELSNWGIMGLNASSDHLTT